jgi:hypothetical protein
MLLNEEIETLRAQDIIPAVRLIYHEEACSDGRPMQAQCCTAAMMTFCRSIMSASGHSNDGIESVLLFVQSSFRWGIKRTDHICDAINCANDGIDCAARSAMALLALKIFLRSVHADASAARCTGPLSGPRLRYRSLQLAVVMIIIRVDPGQARMWRKSIAHLYDPVTGPFVGRWIEDHCIYHQVTGIFDEDSGRLVVWEYGDWLSYATCCEGVLRTTPAAPSRFSNSVVGIRVTPYDMTVPDLFPSTECTGTHAEARAAAVPRFPPSLRRTERHDVFWDGELRVPFDEWVTWGSLATTQQQASPSRPTETGAGALRVFISGCHMSSNPMPGVGVAKSLRERWGGTVTGAAGMAPLLHDTSASGLDMPGAYRPSTLHITAVDDAMVDLLSGLTDCVFDSCRSFSSYGKLRTRAKPLKPPDYLPLHEGVRWSYQMPTEEGDDKKCTNHFSSVSALEDHMLWETVVDMLWECEDPIAGNGEKRTGATFFIPVGIV